MEIEHGKESWNLGKFERETYGEGGGIKNPGGRIPRVAETGRNTSKHGTENFLRDPSYPLFTIIICKILKRTRGRMSGSS